MRLAPCRDAFPLGHSLAAAQAAPETTADTRAEGCQIAAIEPWFAGPGAAFPRKPTGRLRLGAARRAPPLLQGGCPLKRPVFPRDGGFSRLSWLGRRARLAGNFNPEDFPMLARAVLLAGLFLASLTGAQAAPVSATDPNSVLQAIRAHGHKAKMDTNDNGSPLIAVDRDGIKYWVYFYGCENAAGCLDLQFYSSFDLETPLTPDWANQWNYDWVAGRVALDDQGDPALSYFVTTAGGLSQENFAGVMDVWNLTLDGFLADIGW